MCVRWRQNVCKKTPEGHPDHALLAEAAQRMKDTVGDINDTIKQHESRVRVRCSGGADSRYPVHHAVREACHHRAHADRRLRRYVSRAQAKMFDVAYSFVPPQRMLVAAHRHFVKAGPLRYWRNMSVAEPDQYVACRLARGCSGRAWLRVAHGKLCVAACRST